MGMGIPIGMGVPVGMGMPMGMGMGMGMGGGMYGGPVIVMGGGGGIPMGMIMHGGFQPSCGTVFQCKYCREVLSSNRFDPVTSEDASEHSWNCPRRQAFDQSRSMSRPMYSPSSGDRGSRLRANVRVLYHQTDRSCAISIMASGCFRPGDSSAMAGSGIYFAISRSDTDRKAHRRGVYLQATVQLGNVLRISSSGDRSLNLYYLLENGYDSVLIPRPGGDEYVVYSADQVSRISEC